MAYDGRIASAIREEVKNGSADFSFPEFNQRDVADTVNRLANEFGLPETYTDYSNNVVISFPYAKRWYP